MCFTNTTLTALLLTTTLAASQAYGVALLEYDFENPAGSTTSTAETTGNDPAVSGSTFISVDGETSPSLVFSTFGTTTTEQRSIIERGIGTSPNEITAGGVDYFSFTITSSTNFLDLDSITFDANQVGAGNFIGFNASSSVDGHATLLDPGYTSNATSFQAVTLELSDDAALQGLDATGGIEFRIYFANTSSSTGSGVRIDTVRLNGTVADPIPEPASLALLGLGGLFIVGRRRRQD